MDRWKLFKFKEDNLFDVTKIKYKQSIYFIKNMKIYYLNIQFCSYFNKIYV